MIRHYLKSLWSPSSSRLLTGVALLVLSTSAVQCVAAPRPKEPLKVALLPFVNYTESPEAPEVIKPLVVEALKRKGFDLVVGEPIEQFLWQHRIRQTDMVSSRLARWLAEELQVSAVIVGSIILYRPGEAPQVGLAARMVSIPETTILWANDFSLSGEDYNKPLGLGTVRQVDVLAQRLVTQVFDSLQPIRSVQLVPSPDPPSFYNLNLMKPPPQLTYLSPITDFYGLETVGVIPFKNQSERRGAGDIVSVMFLSRLHNTGLYHVIEPGLIREQFLRFRVRARGEIDTIGLRPLNRNIEAQGYITGTVETYDEGILGEVRAPPEVAMSARLLRSDDDAIVWSMRNGYRADNYNLLLDFGRIYSIIPLAQLTIEEMVRTFTGS